VRYGIVSDVHANIQAWNAVLKDMRRQGVDVILCLGDVIGYGPNPAEVLESCYNNCDHFILGNHDAVIGNRLDSDLFNDNAKFLIEWTRTQLSDAAEGFFAEMPLKMSGEGFCCAHGELALPGRFNYIYEAQDATESFNSNESPLMFVGHTHFPAKFSLNPQSPQINTLDATNGILNPHERYLINVGSVGDPRDGQTTASYCIFDQDKNHLSFRKVPFDVEAFRTSLLKVQLPIKPFFLQVFDGNNSETQTIKDMKRMETHQAVKSKADQNIASDSLSKTYSRTNITFCLDSAKKTAQFKTRQKSNTETDEVTKSKTKIIAGILTAIVVLFTVAILINSKSAPDKPKIDPTPKVTVKPVTPATPVNAVTPVIPAQRPKVPERPKLPNHTFAEFEKKLYPVGWKSYGRAFNQTALSTNTLHKGSVVSAIDGKYFMGSLNADMKHSLDALSLTGTLKSPVFKLTHQFLNILLYAPNATKATLVIIDEVNLPIQSNHVSTNTLAMTHLDTSEYIGKRARLTFVDKSTKHFIAFDRITFTDSPKDEFSPGAENVLGTHQKEPQSNLFAEAGSKLLLADFDGTLEILDKIDTSLKKSINSLVTSNTPVLANSIKSASGAKLRINSHGQFLLTEPGTKKSDTYTIKGSFSDSSFSTLILNSTQHPLFKNASGTGANNMFLVPEVKMKIHKNDTVIDVVFKPSPKDTPKVGDLVKEFKRSYISTKKISLENGDHYVITMNFSGAKGKKVISQFPIIVTSAKAKNRVKITTSKDGTCLVLPVKRMPLTNIYTVSGYLSLKSKISAILLEVLDDETLPSSGPGFSKGNFTLTDFSLKVNDKSINFIQCSAEFSNNKFPIAAAIDGKTKSGWAIAPQVGKSHKAVFQLSQPITKTGRATTFKFVLSQLLRVGKESLTIGKFRLSALSDFPKSVKEYKNIKIAPSIKSSTALLGSFTLSFQSKVPEVELYKKSVTNLRNFSEKGVLSKYLWQTFIDDIGKTVELDLIDQNKQAVKISTSIRRISKGNIYLKSTKIQFKHLSKEEIIKRLSRFDDGEVAYWINKKTLAQNIDKIKSYSPSHTLLKIANDSNVTAGIFGKYIDLWILNKTTGAIQINSIKRTFSPKQYSSSNFLTPPNMPGYKPPATLIHSVYNLGRSHNLQTIKLNKSDNEVKALIIRDNLGKVIWQSNVPLKTNTPQTFLIDPKYQTPLKENLAFKKSFTQSNPNANSNGLTDGYYNDISPFSYRTDIKPVFPKTATIDLQTITEINTLRIIPAKTGATKTISFSTSQDGKSFTSAAKVTVPKTNSQNPITLHIKEVKARFVKISFDDHHPDKNGAKHLHSCPLAEFEIYSY
jgi:predicted phosphodiesterase